MTTIDDRLSKIIHELIDNGITLEQAMEVFETKYIAVAMDVNRENVTRASKTLGIHRNTLHNKLRSRTALAGYTARSRPRRRSASNGRNGVGRPKNPSRGN